MSRPVFDTNVFLTYRATISDSDLARMALSIGALYELTATTVDRSE